MAMGARATVTLERKAGVVVRGDDAPRRPTGLSDSHEGGAK